MKKILKEEETILERTNFTKVVIIIVVILVAYFANQIFVVQPRLDREADERRLTEEKNEESLKATLLEACLADAYVVYDTNWGSSCKTSYDSCINMGLTASFCEERWNPDPNDDWSCGLPTSIQQRWDDLHKEGKDECYRKHSSD